MGVPISNVTRRVVFAPSGTGPYAFTFEILAATDIEVYKGDTLLTLTTDYTVTINPNGTGEVNLVATAGTDNITIVGARAIERTTDFVTGGDFFANTVNNEFDSLTIFAQQNSEAVTRSIQAPVTDPTTIDMTLPTKTDRAGKYLSFDTDGDPEVVNTVVDVTAVAANATNINTVAGQITPVNNISTVAGAAANIATVAGISGNVTTVAGISSNVTTVAGISADVTAVAGDATDIGIVAGNITNVNTVAGISSNVTTVAGINANVTTVAGISGNVTTVAGVAANVTTVAGIAANVTTVAGISTDVTTVAGDSADIQLLAANIGTIASKANAGANSDITSLSGLTTPLSVAQGGTGASTLTAENVILGNGTNAVKFVAPGSSGNVLTSNGTTWASTAPTAPTKIEQGNSDVTVTDSGTGKIEFNVDAVEVADFTTGAVVFNETGADQDFRVEGDTDANLFFVDAGAEAVGIGSTVEANSKLTVKGAGIAISRDSSSVSNTTAYDIKIRSASPKVGIHATSPSQDMTLEFSGGGSANAIIDVVSSDGLVFKTNGSERARITSGGEVYIAGTTDQGAYNLQCNGTGVWGAGAYVNGSDERIKDDIEPLASGIDVVEKLNPVTYRYKKDWSKDQSVQTGFIAQELLTALDGQVYVNGVVQQGGPEGYYSVAYQNIIPILTKAIQELKAELDTVKAELAILKGN